MNFDSHSTFFHANLKLLLQKRIQSNSVFQDFTPIAQIFSQFFFTIQYPQKTVKANLIVLLFEGLLHHPIHL